MGIFSMGEGSIHVHVLYSQCACTCTCTCHVVASSYSLQWWYDVTRMSGPLSLQTPPIHVDQDYIEQTVSLEIHRDFMNHVTCVRL